MPYVREKLRLWKIIGHLKDIVLADRLYVTVELMVWVVVCLSVVRHECVVAKRCDIGPRLLLITNRKSHIGFEITWKSLTLDGLEKA